MNNINTHEAGTHVTGFKTALTRSVNAAGQARKLLKPDETLTGDDLKEGLVAVVNVRVPNPQFEGQTKTKLGNSEIKGLVESIVNERLGEFFEENPDIVKAIIAKAAETRRAREAAKRAKELIRAKVRREHRDPAGQAGGLPGKRPRPLRALPRGGRFGGRLRETGQKQGDPGHPPAEREDIEYREGFGGQAVRQQ